MIGRTFKLQRTNEQGQINECAVTILYDLEGLEDGNGGQLPSGKMYRGVYRRADGRIGDALLTREQIAAMEETNQVILAGYDFTI